MKVYRGKTVTSCLSYVRSRLNQIVVEELEDVSLETMWATEPPNDIAYDVMVVDVLFNNLLSNNCYLWWRVNISSLIYFYFFFPVAGLLDIVSVVSANMELYFAVYWHSPLDGSRSYSGKPLWWKGINLFNFLSSYGYRIHLSYSSFYTTIFCCIPKNIYYIEKKPFFLDNCIPSSLKFSLQSPLMQNSA